MATVRVPAALRDLVEGASSLDAPGDTVASVIGSLPPRLCRRVIDEQGRLRPHVNIFVGADNIRDLAGLDTAVAAGAEISVIPAVSGGA